MTQDKPVRPWVRADILGLPIDAVNVHQLHRYLAEVIQGCRKSLVLHLNIHGVNLALKHEWLRKIFESAQLIFCDGDGVRLGLRILGRPVPPKITYDRWIWELAGFAAERGFSLFLLGSKPGIPEQAASRLQARFPKLIIKGCHHGYFDKQGPENESVLAEINRKKPDILIVGLGMPLQEKWLQENFSKLEAKVFLTGGAVFDYASGQARRAPGWMIRFQWEWFFRFLQEPRRLFCRYFIGNPLFLFRILKVRFLRKPL